MYQVLKQISFCYGHRLINYNGKCRHLHGHNGIAEIVLETEELNACGMVVDFFDIKQKISSWIDLNLDHRTILCKTDPLADMLKQNNEPVYLTDENPTAEVIAKEIYNTALSLNFPIVEVRLWESPTSCAIYKR